MSYCSLCHCPSHSLAACPKRRPSKYCETCASLTHRVIGPKCRECGLRYSAEVVVIPIQAVQSSMGMAIDAVGAGL